MSIIAPIDVSNKDYQELKAALHLLEIGTPVNWDLLYIALSGLQRRQRNLIEKATPIKP